MSVRLVTALLVCTVAASLAVASRAQLRDYLLYERAFGYGSDYGYRIRWEYNKKRWGRDKGKRHGRWVAYWESNGLKQGEGHHPSAPGDVTTRWDIEGRVIDQSRVVSLEPFQLEQKTSPPWWNGISNQRKIDGAFVGTFCDYRDIRHKRLQSHYRHGQPHGVWTWWDVSGEVVQQRHYKNGALVQSRTSAPWLGEVKTIVICTPCTSDKHGKCARDYSRDPILSRDLAIYSCNCPHIYHVAASSREMAARKEKRSD